MAAPIVYRVPRRFITFPQDPPPYGLVAVSFLGHMLCFGGALALSAFLGSRIDQSKVYIVNLVPAAPSLGSPATAPASRERAPEAPRPSPPTPKVEEKAPPKAAKLTEPPRPERPPERVVEPPPPRAPEVAAARPKLLEPAELALPKRVEKETPALPPPPAARPVERTLPPPPPVTPPVAAPPPQSTPPRLPEPPRIAAPPAAPTAPLAPAATTAASRPATEPLRPGRTAGPSVSGSNVSVEASDFPFTYYMKLIHSKVHERWTVPRAAITGGERTVVLFEIRRDGQVAREPVVERSSGNPLYDQAALRAVIEASPFPPLPPEFKGAQSLTVHIGFDWTPDQG